MLRSGPAPVSARPLYGGAIVALVQPAKPRAKVADTPQGLEIVVPAQRNWFVTFFLGFWLCGWAIGEISVPLLFLSKHLNPGELAFMSVWLVLWTLGGGFALCGFLWMLAGRERVFLSPAHLSIKREIFRFGRLREYELSNVSDLRVAPNTYSPFDFRSGFAFWGNTGGVIAFDHGAATVRFGAGLEEGEAKSLVRAIRSRAEGIGEAAV